MKRVRLSEQMAAELEEAARISGESVSSIIRRAVQDRCRSILRDRLDARVIDVAGTIQSKGGRTRRSGRAFAESLLQRKGGGS